MEGNEVNGSKWRRHLTAELNQNITQTPHQTHFFKRAFTTGRFRSLFVNGCFDAVLPTSRRSLKNVKGWAVDMHILSPVLTCKNKQTNVYWNISSVQSHRGSYTCQYPLVITNSKRFSTVGMPNGTQTCVHLLGFLIPFDSSWDSLVAPGLKLLPLGVPGRQRLVLLRIQNGPYRMGIKSCKNHSSKSTSLP